jgi:hypothetical protein
VEEETRRMVDNLMREELELLKAVSRVQFQETELITVLIYNNNGL